MSAPQDDAGDSASQAFARLERAKQINVKCAAKQRAIRDELRRMKQRNVELATMHKMNKGQRDLWMQDLIEKTIIPYSKAWNRKFAQRIQKVFPPEIRSMVYSYLMDKDMWDHFVCPLQAVTSVLPPYVGHCKCMTTGHGMPRAPHFLYPEYVGHETASGIVEMIYTDEWFNQQTLHGTTSNLEALIHKDPFGTGFDPAPHIRGLDIVCNVDRYRKPRVFHTGNDSNVCRHASTERSYIDQKKLETDFGHLLDVIHNPKFCELDVTFVQRNVRLDVLEEAMECFTDIYRACEEADINMDIHWKYSSPTCGDVDRHAHSKHDMGEFYYLPRQFWKHRMLQTLNKVKPRMQKTYVRFVNEPSVGLSNEDFVHRMWDDDEKSNATDDEDSEDDCEQVKAESDSEAGSGSDAIYLPDGRLYAE